MSDYYHIPREKAFSYVYVKKVMKQYGLNHSEGLSVFNAVSELIQSRSTAEIRRVQGFCFHAYDNRALQDIYWVITRQMGAYPTRDYPAVLRLRRKLRRDAPEAHAEIVLKRILREVLELFSLPDEAWQRGGNVPKVRRINTFDKPVLSSRGKALAWAREWPVSQQLESTVRTAGEEMNVSAVGHELTQSAFVKSCINEDKETIRGNKDKVKLEDEDERDTLYQIIYALARLGMCDTDGQAAVLMGYIRITFPGIYAPLSQAWPEMNADEYARMATRIPARLAQSGNFLRDEAVDAVAAALGDMATDEPIRQIISKGGLADGKGLLSVNDALRILVSHVKKAMRYTPYKGRLSARDKTKTAYNSLKQAQYVELEDLGKPVAMAESMQAAKLIVAAFDKQGREAAERRLLSRLDRLLSADDLV